MSPVAQRRTAAIAAWPDGTVARLRGLAASYPSSALVLLHLGLALSPVATGSRMKLDPPKMFAALQRGAACNIDPTDGWDP